MKMNFGQFVQSAREPEDKRSAEEIIGTMKEKLGKLGGDQG